MYKLYGIAWRSGDRGNASEIVQLCLDRAPPPLSRCGAWDPPEPGLVIFLTAQIGYARLFRPLLVADLQRLYVVALQGSTTAPEGLTLLLAEQVWQAEDRRSGRPNQAKCGVMFRSGSRSFLGHMTYLGTRFVRGLKRDDTR